MENEEIAEVILTLSYDKYDFLECVENQKSYGKNTNNSCASFRSRLTQSHFLFDLPELGYVEYHKTDEQEKLNKGIFFCVFLPVCINIVLYKL